MSVILKSPDEVKKIALSANKAVEIDTKGLYCELKPSTKIFVKAKSAEADEDAFPVNADEKFEFCGRLTAFAKESASIYCVFYTLN